MPDLLQIGEFARGPMIWICVAIFFIGNGVHIFKFCRLSRNTHLITIKRPIGYRKQKARTFSREMLISKIARFRVSLVGIEPVMAFVTITFHLCLFILPLFILEHAVLYLINWRLDIWPIVFSRQVTDFMVLYLLGCTLFFLFRRLFIRRVRALSTARDYCMLTTALIPFVTGFMAIHHVTDYASLITIHILSVELLLVIMPFTKFAHMLFFFINRFTLASEYSLARGHRTWSPRAMDSKS